MIKKKNKIPLILCLAAITIIIVGLYLNKGEIFSPKSDYDIYESYVKGPSYSSKKELQLENSVYYIYVGDESNIKVISANRDIELWASNDDNVVKVDGNGNITGIGEGRTEVLAVLDDLEYAKVEVVVVDKRMTTIEEVIDKDAKSFAESKTEEALARLNKKTSIPEAEDVPIDDIIYGYDPVSNIGEDTSEPKVVTPIHINPTDDIPDPTAPPVSKPVRVASVGLEKTEFTGYTLEEEPIKLTISPYNATDKSTLWSSSDNNVVSIINGVLKYKRAGTATITATVDEVKASAKVTVKSRDRIHFISHGEANGNNYITGDAILLESNGSFGMIDMGNTEVSSRIVDYLIDNNITTLDFVLFTHMDSDSAGNLQSVLSAGIRIKEIWMKNYDVESYRTNYVTKLNNEGIDLGIGEQVKEKNDHYHLNNALARYRRIRYLSEYSNLKDLVDSIKIISNAADGTLYTFKNLKFSMTLYNNTRNVNAIYSENYNSISSLIEVNGHKVLLMGDDFDTKRFNTTAKKIGKIDVLKLANHGSRACSLLQKKYKNDKVNNNGTMVTSTAIDSLKPNYYVVTSSNNKITNIRNEYNVATGNMCVDKVPNNSDVRYVDETDGALLLDLSESTINFITK